MKSIFLKTKYDADSRGHFKKFGGRYVPEMLIPALEELEKSYAQAKKDPTFMADLMDLFKNYSGRPTPLYLAKNLSGYCGGTKIFLKLEGLNHTGAHKINNCLGQALLAKRMRKTRLIAETGAGQHGVATATVAAKFGMRCRIYMGKIDYDRQRPNVFWMEQLGAEVVPVLQGTQRLKDAVTATLQDWITNVDDTFYLLGSALGPHPYPSMVRDFQTIIGLEVQEQLKNNYHIERPDFIIACVGGGSNAIGIFNPYLGDKRVRLIGVEAGGEGIHKVGRHAVRMQKKPRIGVVEGYKSYFLQDDDGQVQDTHSIAAGLDYAGIGPEHALLFEEKRVVYEYATDKEVIEAFKLLARKEGIIAALESCHAVAYAMKLAKTLDRKKNIVVNLSGRGDKDIFIVAEALQDVKWKQFIKEQSMLDN